MLEAVAVAVEVDDLGVVDEAVDHGADGDGVAEDLGPAAERLVAAEDEAGAFVATGDQGVEQRGGLWLERDVADLVADQQRDPAELVELGVEPARALGGVEALDPLVGGGERDAVSAAGGVDREGDAEVVPVPGGPKNSTFLASSRKSSCAKCSTTCFLTDR